MPIIWQPAKSGQTLNIAKYPLVTNGYGAANYVVNSGLLNSAFYLVGSQTIIINSGKSISISGSIDGPGNLLLPKSGSFTILGNAGYTGETIVNGNFAINVNSNMTFNSPISGLANVSASGVGNVTFTSPSSYSGTTTVANGTISTSINNAFSTNTINNSGILWFNPKSTSTSNLTYTNNINFTNNSIIRCGFPTFSNTAGSVTLTGNINISGTNCFFSSVYSANVIINNIVSGSAKFVVKNIPGTPGGPVNNQGAHIILNSTSNNWTGGTWVDSSNIAFVGGNANANILIAASLGSGPIQLGNGGFGDAAVLIISANNAINANSVITFFSYSGAYYSELRLNGFSTHCGGISNNGHIRASSAGTLTLNTNTNLNFVGLIADAISIVMQGSATQTLNGTNSYTESTTVLSGVLNFPGAVPASSQWIINVNNTGPTSTGGLITLVGSPNLSGKTINILCSGTSTGLNLVVVSWSGTATGSPNLELNGTPVVSGVPSGGITITYNTSGTITITS